MERGLRGGRWGEMAEQEQMRRHCCARSQLGQADGGRWEERANQECWRNSSSGGTQVLSTTRAILEYEEPEHVFGLGTLIHFFFHSCTNIC